MPRLSDCLAKAGLSEHEAAILRGKVEEFSEHYEEGKAAKVAVMDHLADLQGQFSDITKQVSRTRPLEDISELHADVGRQVATPPEGVPLMKKLIGKVSPLDERRTGSSTVPERYHDILAARVKELLRLGVPEARLDGLQPFHTFESNLDARYLPNSQSIGHHNEMLAVLHDLRGESNNAAQSVKVTADLAHETRHHEDNMGDGDFASMHSPLFAITEGKNGREAKGPVIAEALRVFNDSENTKLQQFLKYPMASFFEKDGSHDRPTNGFLQTELYAQLGSLYDTNPRLMKAELPEAFALFDRIHDATQASRTIDDVRSAVRGALRTPGAAGEPATRDGRANAGASEQGLGVRAPGAGLEGRGKFGRGERATGSGESRFPRRDQGLGAAQPGSGGAEQAPALKGLPASLPGPHQPARDAAERYMKAAGLKYDPPTDYVRVDPARSKRIADAFEAMKHDPENPAVKAAYRAMIDETIAQWAEVKKTGLKVTFADAEHPYPYKTPHEMFADVRDNNHMWVFPTEGEAGGFGDVKLDVSKNPLLEGAGKISGQYRVANDVFRIVHDFFGHLKEGVGFRANGEENAWRAHSAMYSDEARKAMTSETRGQNSWVNYGPHGEENRKATQENTKYAPQKTGLLPDEFIKDNYVEKLLGREKERVEIPAREIGPIGRHLTAEERGDLSLGRTVMDRVKRLSDLAQEVPTSAKDIAHAALAGKMAKGWYERSRLAVEAMYGPDAPRFLSLMAALSPQTDVPTNFYNAARIWSDWNNRGRPTSANALKKIFDKNLLTTEGLADKREAMDAWTQNGARALTTVSPERTNLSGPKVESFRRNLMGDMQEVTNDRHIASLMGIARKVLEGLKTNASMLLRKGPGYIAVSARIREAADIIGKLTGEKWSPAEVQETAWSFWRALKNLSSETGESAVQLLRTGALTHEMIKQVPDLGSYFSEDAYRNITKGLAQGRGVDLAEAERIYAAIPRPAGETGPIAGGAALGRVAARVDQVLSAEREKKAARLSEATTEGSGTTPERVKAIADDVTSKLDNAAPITVVPDVKSLPFAASDATRGAFHDGTVYLVARNLHSPADVHFVLLHEQMGHYGLRGVLGDSLNGMMERIYDTNETVRGLADARRARDADMSKALSVEEALSDLAGTGKLTDLPGWRMWVASIRQALREFGFDVKMSDNDIAALLANSRKFVTKGESRAAKLEVAPALSEKAPTWYSALTQGMSRAPFDKRGTIDSAQLKGWMDARVKDGLFKRDEIEWTGLNDLLRMKPKLTRDEVNAFLGENQVRVGEVLKRTVEGANDLPDGWSITDRREPDGHYRVYDDEGQSRGSGNTREEALAEARDDSPSGLGGTQYDSHQLPGGKNYRELLITLPPQKLPSTWRVERIPEDQRGPDEMHAGISWEVFDDEGMQRGLGNTHEDAIRDAQGGLSYGKTFASGHFAEPNVLAHIRFNERTDADGKRVLFIEEIQSDWAQKGRKEGFNGAESVRHSELEKKIANHTATDAEFREFRSLDRAGMGEGIPNAPFVGKTEAWVGLAMKRIIRHAAENGFDAIAFTTGDQQAARYDLSKHVSEVVAYRDAKDADQFKLSVHTHDKGQQPAIMVRRDALAAHVGKELAEKIAAQKNSIQSYSGLDLKIGGDGMRGFYDRILPSVANDLLRRFGDEKVGTVAIPNEYSRRYDYVGSKEAYLTQPGFEITPKLKESALSGLPLFSLSTDGVLGAIKQEVLDRFTWSSHKMPWLNAVNTQAYKARVVPEYRPVYQGIQRYIQDISAVADSIASLAGEKVLPQLKHFSDAWRGIFNTKEVEADKAAVAKVVFGGTLIDLRPTDEMLKNGFLAVLRDEDRNIIKEVRIPGLNARQIQMYHGTDKKGGVRGALDLALTHGAVSEMVRLTRNDNIDEARAEAKDNPDRAAMILLVALQEKKLEAAAGQNESMYQSANSSHEKIQQLHADLESIKNRGYAPLQRFGRYTVEVKRLNDAGEAKREEFFMFEDKKSANQALRDIKAEHPDAIVTTGEMDPTAWKAMGGLSLDSLEVFAKSTGMNSGIFGDAVQEYLKMAVSSRSTMKRLIARKGIEGFSEDLSRVLAGFTTSQARLTSRNYHMYDAMSAAEAIPTEMGRIKGEAKELVRYLQNPMEEAQTLRGLLFVNFIGGSVASALTNITQPILMTHPYLTQFGGPGLGFSAANLAYNSLLHALKVMKDPANASPALAEAMALAAKRGITEPQEIHQLHAEAIQNFGSSLGVRRAARIWGSMFSMAESFNRKITFNAAFEMAEKVGMEQINAKLRERGEQMVETPFDFAEKVVADTQGIYNKGNRPNWARGPIGATLFTFKQFGISYVEFLARLPAREKALAMSMLVLGSGVQGLPFAQDLEDLVDTIGQSLGFATNSKKSVREWAVRTLGEAGGGLLNAGVTGSKGSPLDVSGRLSMGNLIPGTAFFKPSTVDAAQEITDAAGPAGAVLMNARKAYQAAQAGQYGIAAQTVLPRALGDMVHAVDMWQTGQYRDEKGRKVVDTDGTDALLKSVGIQPGNVGYAQRLAGDVRQDVNLHQAVESSIVDRWARGIIDHDPESIQKAMADMNAWNIRNPEQRIVIQGSQVGRRVREAAQEREQRIIKSAPKEIRGEVSQTLRP